MLILPGNPLFDFTLATAKRPDWQQVAEQDDFVSFCALPGDSGLMVPMTWDEMVEYVEGGAYNERLEELGELDDEEMLE